MNRSHLIHAHTDENAVVDMYWRLNFPSLRTPISGAGKWKGDVVALTFNGINICDIKRTEVVKTLSKEQQLCQLTFLKKDILEIHQFCNSLRIFPPHKVKYLKIIHFPAFKKWYFSLIGGVEIEKIEKMFTNKITATSIKYTIKKVVELHIDPPILNFFPTGEQMVKENV